MKKLSKNAMFLVFYAALAAIAYFLYHNPIKIPFPPMVVTALYFLFLALCAVALISAALMCMKAFSDVSTPAKIGLVIAALACGTGLWFCVMAAINTVKEMLAA